MVLKLLARALTHASPNSGGIPTLPDQDEDEGLGEALPELDVEVWSSRALLIVLLLLILSFWVSYYLKVRRIRSIHETIVALFAGMCVGLLVRLSPGHVVQNMISFKSTILLNVLLPPIILNSGYMLKQDNFFRNFAVILTFAFAGTFISAVALGVIVYLYSLLGLEGLSLTIIECLLFGSTLSATDPVTILAIFNALHVDPKLYSVIFGESILNDAVAIVMFETLSQFHGSQIHVLSFFHGVGIFLLTFCISMALGVIFGLSCSLMLKHSELGRYTEIESCLVFLIAYTSYFFSNALTMSGIVSLLFCGITLKHYAYHNMSHKTQRTSRYMFGTLAQLCENFIFIYLGLSLFTEDQLVYKPMFILVTAVAVCIARYCAVFPISKLINLFFRARGSRTDELPHSYQMMLFWAGLRGAVGVALAAGMKGENAVALRTTVLVTVVLTVVVFGGTIGRMIEILGIRTGVDDDDEDGESDEEGAYVLVGGVNGGDDLEHNNVKRKRRSRDLSSKGGIVGGVGMNGMGGGGSTSHVSSTTDDDNTPYRDNRNSRTIRTSSFSRTSSGASVGLSRDGGPGDLSDEISDVSDAEVLPPVSSSSVGEENKDGDLTRVWRDGQWFTVLDERYLLPVFSNATASRRQATKKALRAKRHSFAPTGQAEGEGEAGDASIPNSPYLSSALGGRREFQGSFTDILSSLVGTSSTSNTSPPSSYSHQQQSPGSGGNGSGHKRKDSSIGYDDFSGDGAGETIDLTLTPRPLSGSTNVRPRGSVSTGTTPLSSPVPTTPVMAFRDPSTTGKRSPGGSASSSRGGKSLMDS